MTMIKKFFFGILIIVILVVVYSIFQKKNPVTNKVLNAPNEETKQPSGMPVNQPTSGLLQPQKDSQAIFLEVAQPINNSMVANTIASLTGRTIPNASVFVNDQELKADANGNFSTSVTLDEGQNDIYVVAADDLGNSVEKDIIVNIESTQ